MELDCWDALTCVTRQSANSQQSSVQVVRLYVSCDLSLPQVPVVEQLLLVVQQLLVGLSGELKVWALGEQEEY